MATAYAHKFDENIDYEDFNEKLEKKDNVTDLKAGVYIIKNYKKIPLKGVLNYGGALYKISPYSRDALVGILFFTGKIVYKNNEAYEMSQIGGDPVTFGKVPAGTLLVALDAD